MRNSERLDLNYAKVQWASLSLYRCMQEEFCYVSELVPLSTVQVLRRQSDLETFLRLVHVD